MDLVRFLTYVVQEIHNERKPYIDGLIERPGNDACDINNKSGYICGLSKTEEIIRKMVNDYSSGNLRVAEEITISPLSHHFFNGLGE